MCVWCVFACLCLCLQLALRLHPDKNKAHKADEAFKLLSKAFSCLSNPDKRAYYDRYVASRGGMAPCSSVGTLLHAGHRRGRQGSCSFLRSYPATAVKSVTVSPCAQHRLLTVLHQSLHGQ